MKKYYPWSICWEIHGKREFAPVGSLAEAKQAAEVMFNFLSKYFPGEKMHVLVERTSIARKLFYQSTGYCQKIENITCHFGCSI